MSANTEVVLRWIADESFEVIKPERAGPILDGNRKEGPSPMESLLASLCACMGIDVVMILTKMRAAPGAVEIRALGERNEEPPRYFRKIDLEFRIRGPLPEKQVERAVSLSFEKYCSVWHSLRSDIEVGHTIVRE